MLSTSDWILIISVVLTQGGAATVFFFRISNQHKSDRDALKNAFLELREADRRDVKNDLAVLKNEFAQLREDDRKEHDAKHQHIWNGQSTVIEELRSTATALRDEHNKDIRAIEIRLVDRPTFDRAMENLERRLTDQVGQLSGQMSQLLSLVGKLIDS